MSIVERRGPPPRYSLRDGFARLRRRHARKLESILILKNAMLILDGPRIGTAWHEQLFYAITYIFITVRMRLGFWRGHIASHAMRAV